MSEQLIGANIRAIRQASKASLDDVAKRAGITKSTLSKIENAKISTPISTLVAIAKALGVRLAAFFKEEEVSGYVLTRNGKGKAIVRDGTRFGYTYEALAIDFQNKPVEPFFLTISPGDKEGKFQHEGQEFIYMLSGKIELTLGEDKIELNPGDSIYFDSTIHHSLRLLGTKPANFLCFFIDPS